MLGMDFHKKDFVKITHIRRVIILVGQLQWRVAKLEKLYSTLQQFERDNKLLKHDNAILKVKLDKYQNPKNSVEI